MHARQPMSGLHLRGKIWHIKKRYKYFPGGRLCKSTGYTQKDLDLAELCLANEMLAARSAVESGVRPPILWSQAADKYVNTHRHKASIQTDITHLKQLAPYLDHLSVAQVHDGTLAQFKKERKAAGVKQKSINNALSVVRRILHLAARSWRHDLPNGQSLSWLDSAPFITLPPVNDAAHPYPLSRDEESRLLSALPDHLADMALFKVNTGTRDQEVCQLRWEWEVDIPELKTSVFIIPGYLWRDDLKPGDDPEGLVKNREDRLIVLNHTALSLIHSRRGKHPEFVFSYRGQPIQRMHNSGWKTAWRKAGLPISRHYRRGVHNLKHTFGRRLRAAGVSLETRQVLLGHTNHDITTYYSAAEIQELIDASNTILETNTETPTLTLLKLNIKDGWVQNGNTR